MNADEIKSNTTRAASIVLAWAAGRYHLDPTQVGAMMSDVGYVGSVGAFFYGMYQHFGMKKVPEASVAVQVKGIESETSPGAGVAVGAVVTGKVVGCLAAVGLVALALSSSPASAQGLKLVKPTGNLPADIRAATTATASSAAQNSIETFLAKPFKELADFIGADSDTAIALSTQIPELQDGHGQQCWLATRQFGEVVKAHPIPLTLKAQTDLEALRLLMMAANNLCANVHCTQVFDDLKNGVQTLAPLNASIPLPGLHDLCAKVPQIAVIAPISVPAPVVPVAPTP